MTSLSTYPKNMSFTIPIVVIENFLYNCPFYNTLTLKLLFFPLLFWIRLSHSPVIWSKIANKIVISNVNVYSSLCSKTVGTKKLFSVLTVVTSEHVRVLNSTYYEAGINWPKKFPAKNICWYWFYVCFCFVGNYSANWYRLRSTRSTTEE